jgi:hypothetical protein
LEGHIAIIWRAIWSKKERATIGVMMSLKHPLFFPFSFSFSFSFFFLFFSWVSGAAYLPVGGNSSPYMPPRSLFPLCFPCFPYFSPEIFYPLSDRKNGSTNTKPGEPETRLPCEKTMFNTPQNIGGCWWGGRRKRERKKEEKKGIMTINLFPSLPLA